MSPRRELDEEQRRERDEQRDEQELYERRRERDEQKLYEQRREQKRKRRRDAFRERSAKRQPGQVHTILSFCFSNMISESFYYSLKRRGKGPREIELAGRILITEQAEQDWRREREAETQELRAKREREQTAAANITS